MGLFIRRAANFLILMALLSATACSQPATKNSPKKSGFDIKSLAKSDIDGVLDIHVREARGYLRELMVKLYKRNPRELEKSPYQDVKKNMSRIFDQQHGWKYKELDYKKNVDAIYLALDANYAGDRVFAFMAGLTSMIMQAYGDKKEFYILDSIEPQKLYNSARNIEVAVWKLEHATDANGDLMLYTNSLPGEPVNLSYERLFGKLIATQDTIAIIIADRTNRTIKKIIQQMATAVFLPI